VGASVRHTPTMNHRKPAGTKRKTERKRKDERKMDRWAKEGERGEGPGGEMARGRGGEGGGGVWGQFFFVWCQIWHLHYTSKSRLLVHNNFFLIPKKSTILGSSEKVRIPPNCKFHRHSLTHPPPSDFLAKFHVLCVID